MLSSKTFFQFFLEFRFCRRDIIQIIRHHLHNGSCFGQLLCYCQTTLDHTVQPHEILLFAPKLFAYLFQILHGSPAHAPPLRPDFLYFLLIAFFQGTYQCFSSLIHGSGLASPADILMITSAAKPVICIIQYMRNLSTA